MNTYKIEWKKHPIFSDRIDGIVNGTCLFFIDKRGKRVVKYVLQSCPFFSIVFPKANTSKKLSEDIDLDFLKKKAEIHFLEFCNSFVQPEPCDDGTLVLFTLYHREANYHRGIQTSDIDDLKTIAAKFEKKYNELRPGGKDWEKSKNGWEDTVIEFYNKHKPQNWNPIV